MAKVVYELCEVRRNPRRNDTYFWNHKVYNNALYIEAENSVVCDLDEQGEIEDIPDEELEKRVEEKFKNILETLDRCGRYPETGRPLFVMFDE